MPTPKHADDKLQAYFPVSAAIPHKMVVLIKVYHFQLPDHDELLTK